MIKQSDPYDTIRQAYLDGVYAGRMHQLMPSKHPLPDVEDYINKLKQQPLVARFGDK